MAFYLSPGVYPVETDLSQRIAAIGTSTGACVFGSRRGPVTPQYVGSGQQFISLYGEPDPSWGPAHDCILAYLQQAPMWLSRVINGATYSGLTVLNNKDLVNNPTETDIAYFPSGGASKSYADGAGSVNYYQLFFSASLITSNVFGVDISDGVNTSHVSVNFNTDNDTTMLAIASALQSALNTFFSVSGWLVYPVYPANQTNTYREIRIVAPLTGQVVLSNASVTGGASQATVTLSDEPVLFDVYAENPGAWSSNSSNNSLGIKIVDVDIGTSQQQTITFGGALIASNQLVMSVNGTLIKRHIRQISYSSAFVVGNLINITIQGQPIAAVTFNTDNATTYQLVQTALLNVLDASFSVGIDPVGGIITVTGYDTIDISLATVTGGASQASATIGSDSQLNYVPYNESNDDTLRAISYAIGQATLGTPATTAGSGTNKVAVTQFPSSTQFFPIVIDDEALTGGVSQVSVAVTSDGIVFGGALITGNIFNCTVNGIAIEPVKFHTNSDTTIVDIASAINKVLASQVASVVASGVLGDSAARQIIVTAPFAGTNVTISGVALTGGSSQATITTTESLTGVAPTGQFTLEVYTRENTNTPIERHRVSLDDQQDGNGNQINISEVINNSIGKSAKIRIWQPSWSKTSKLIPFLYNSRWVVTRTIVWLANGSDGNAITSSKITSGWNALTNRDKYNFRVMINGGYTQVSVQQTMEALARSRRDCIAVLDMPSNYQNTTDSVNYRKNVLNINSSYAAIYTPDLLIRDEFTDKSRYIPPSGHVGATYAYTDTNAQTWFSPAGIQRGQVYGVQDLRVAYEQADRDLMSPAQVNAIINKPGKGWVVWDDQTLQAMASSLSYVHIRRLLILIEVSLVDALDFQVFNPNDAFTRFQIIQMVNNFLQPIKNGRGLYRFLVVCDESNNPNSSVAAGQLNVDIYLDPVLQVRAIKLQSIITATGASFAELVAASAVTQ